MYRMFFVFLKCTIQGGPKVDLLLIAYLHIWLKFWEGIDKYWIVPVRKLFYFHHWSAVVEINLCYRMSCKSEWLKITVLQNNRNQTTEPTQLEHARYYKLLTFWSTEYM